MRYLFTACLLLLNYSIFSQNYDLNTYKFRYQKWRLMGVNFNFSGNHDQFSNNTENTWFNYSQRGDTTIASELSQNAHRLSFIAPLNYRNFVNTDRLQQDQSFSYRVDLSKNKTNDYREFSTNQSLNYYISNRFYKDKNFNEINFSSNNFLVTGLYDQKDNVPTYPRKTSHVQSQLNYNISLGKGRGRMEYVTDAVTAMFLLKDLKSKAGTGNYSNEQIESVAKGITTIRNRRYMDFRFGLIDQLSMLDSILRINHFTTDNSMRFFTTINDNWLYATNFQRYSGSRWSVNLISEGTLDRNKNVQVFHDTDLRIENTFFRRKSFEGLAFNYSHSKQLGLFLQKNYGFTVSGGIIFNTSEQTSATGKGKNDNMLYSANGNWGYLFQPNTRTYLTLNIFGNARIEKDLNGLRTSNYFGQNWEAISASIGSELNFFRFISPKLYYHSRITFQYSEDATRYFSNYHDFKTNRNSLPFDFQMGLTYLFF